MTSYKKRGIKNFKNKNYTNALIHFSLALQHDVNDIELRIYLNLTSLAKTREDEAISLFEFYRASLKDKFSKNSVDIEKAIDSLEVGLEKIHNLFESQEIEKFLLEENGISYDDFLYLVHERGSFAKTFEDIMFSTRVLISKKEDFVHFLNLLVDNGFTDMALNYLENAVTLFPGDITLQDIADKVEERK